MPMLARWVTVAALFAGVTGGIVGLVIGLFAYAPTAPFAVVEIGFPATILGAIVGLVAGTIAAMALRIRRHLARPRINHFQGHQRR
jgi:hypothetical protein